MRATFSLHQPEPLTLILRAELFSRFKHAVHLAADIAAAALFMDGDEVTTVCDLTLEVVTSSLRLGTLAAPVDRRHLGMLEELAAKTIGAILDNQRFPRICFSANFPQPQAEVCRIPGVVELCGKRAEVAVDVHWSETPQGAISACVQTSFCQSAFGLIPYRAMLGAIKVSDLVHLKASLDLVPNEALSG